MKTARARLALTLLLLLPACAPGLAEEHPASPPAAPGLNVLETAIHDEINGSRAAHDLPPLRFDAHLAEIAREHSHAMADGRRSFGHEDFRARARTVRSALPGSRAVAENVASEPGVRPDPSVIVGRWLQSNGHRRNIHDGAHSKTGIGISRAANGELFLTQIFVEARDASAVAR